MKNFKIYLAGGMTGLSWEEQNSWRDAVKEWLSSRECDYHLIIINPCDYYKIGKNRHKSEREVMDFDKYHVRTSDLIIVNYNAPDSIGTSIEIGLANELHKPVIGLNELNLPIHSWLKDMTDRMCDSMDELLNYIYEFYLLA